MSILTCVSGFIGMPRPNPPPGNITCTGVDVRCGVVSEPMVGFWKYISVCWCAPFSWVCSALMPRCVICGWLQLLRT
jgi:hypothetical protein